MLNKIKISKKIWFFLFCSPTGETIRCLNLGSYNYLGFAGHDDYCTPRVIESLKTYSPSTSSVRVDGGIIYTYEYMIKLLLLLKLTNSTCAFWPFLFWTFIGKLTRSWHHCAVQGQLYSTRSWRMKSQDLLGNRPRLSLAWDMLQILLLFLPSLARWCLFQLKGPVCK